MSLDGRKFTVPIDLHDNGVPSRTASCGGSLYMGPGGSGFRRCGLGHTHCTNCGGVARKYGRTFSCVTNCKGK